MKRSADYCRAGQAGCSCPPYCVAINLNLVSIRKFIGNFLKPVLLLIGTLGYLCRVNR